MELTGRSDPEGFSILIEADWEQGHTGEVFATRFDATGQLIASGSMDRSISMFSAHHTYHF